MGSAVIGQQATLLVDIHEILEILYPHWFS